MSPAPETGFPRPIPPPMGGGRLSPRVLMGCLVAAGLLVLLLTLLLRGRDETLEVKRVDEAVALGHHMAQVSLTLGDAILDALRPYCLEDGCRRAKVTDGAFQAWDYVATPAGLRVLLYAYFEQETHAPMARVRIDAATMRSDGDLTKDFPVIGEMVNRLLQKLQFPAAYKNGTCTGLQTSGVNSFTCETGPYDPVFGAFDSRDRPTVRLFKSSKTFTLTSRGPWRYDGSNGKVLRYGP